MKPKEFDFLMKALVGEVIAPLGFSCDESKHCTFSRKVSEDISHFIVPDPGSRGAWFDVKVFASSPKIDPLFGSRFPDSMGIPSDSFCYLNERTGIGSEQQTFKCETDAELREVFASKVAPLLLQRAIPYLDAIDSVSTLLPLIRNKMTLALAINAVGDQAAARPLLKAELTRLEGIKKSNPGHPEVEAMYAHFEGLLE